MKLRQPHLVFSYLAFSMITCLLCVLCLYGFVCTFFVKLAIVSIDTYLVFLLLASSFLGDLSNIAAKEHFKVEKKIGSFLYKIMPTRLMGLFLFIIFLVTITFGFAAIYLENGQHFEAKILTPCDALYFSFGVLTTITFGEFKPIDGTGRLLVSLEVVNSVILFFGAFALLVSRLASFSKPT